MSTLIVDPHLVAQATSARAWPEPPYKAFSAYGPDDAPLFSGRNDDIRRVANLIGNANTRVVFLHGKSGCGKSSFLRAGLIPYLQRQLRIEFVSHGQEVSAMFITCTDKPLVELSKKVYEFCKADFIVTTPDGRSDPVGLPKLVGGLSDTDFISKYGNDPAALLQLLRTLAARLPTTFAILIDQAEQVLTIDLSTKGDANREHFFTFLAGLEAETIDLKLLVALRSEKFADFHTSVERINHEFTFKTYGLQELSAAQMRDAILRPTLETQIEGWGIPYQQYKFKFETGLADTIVNNVLGSGSKGGALVSLQLICDRLYSLLRPKDRSLFWEITARDYESLGSREAQVLDTLDAELRKMVVHNGDPGVQVLKEVFSWKKTLGLLVAPQVDGTVVTVLRPRTELEELAKRNRCRVPVDEAVAYLTKDEVRILKREDVVVVGGKESRECYALAHDAISLALHFWDGLLQEQKQRAKRQIRGSLVASIAAVPVMAAIFGFASDDAKLAVVVAVSYIIAVIVTVLGASLSAGSTFGGFFERYPILLKTLVSCLPTDAITAIMSDAKRKEALRLLAPELYDAYLERNIMKRQSRTG